jgi:hypothetical protein
VAQLDEPMIVAPTSGEEFVAFDAGANDRDVRDLHAYPADACRAVRAAVQVDRSITEHRLRRLNQANTAYGHVRRRRAVTNRGAALS